jgi:hypothetical protein
LTNFECKHLEDYLSLKFYPTAVGTYLINFLNCDTSEPVASSPYEIVINENLKEIIKSSGIYDITRLIITEDYWLAKNKSNNFEITVYGKIYFFHFNC